MFSWMPQGSAWGGTPVNTFGANASGMGAPVNTMFGTNPNAGGMLPVNTFGGGASNPNVAFDRPASPGAAYVDGLGYHPAAGGNTGAGTSNLPPGAPAPLTQAWNGMPGANGNTGIVPPAMGGSQPPSFPMPSGAFQGPSWTPGMTAGGGGFGAALSSAQGQVSPYLKAQLGALQQQGTQNILQNILPGIRSQAAGVGGIGGAREGIAEGVAAGNAQAGIAAAQANALNDAYNQAQNRALQGYGMDQNNALGFLNSDRSYATALGGLGNQAYSNQTARDLGFGNLGLGYGNLGLGYTQAGNQYALGQAQNQTNRDLGFGNLGLGYTNAGNSYSLGLGNLGLGYTQAGNQYALGQGQLALGNKTADQNYNLGQGNLGFNYYNAGNQYALGMGGLQNQLTGLNQNYDLGLRNNALGYFNGANSYNLGLGQNQNQAQQIANNYNLGQGQLQLGNQNSMLDFFNTQGNQDIQRYLAGLQGFQVGSNSPWGPLSQFGNLLSPYTGQGTTTQNSSQGGGAMGAVGGALGAWQLANLLGRQP